VGLRKSNILKHMSHFEDDTPDSKKRAINTSRSDLKTIEVKDSNNSAHPSSNMDDEEVEMPRKISTRQSLERRS
jgi:hypothetical protein